jgi:prepilin-type N-terminal cleavage/methylation domain-containing protein
MSRKPGRNCGGVPRSHRASGFSMVELLVAVAIILVVSGMAMPHILTAVETVRLRSAANDAASLIQATRMLAVKNNTYYSAGWATVGSGTSSYRIMYADVKPADGHYNVGEPMVQLPYNVQFDPSGANPAFDHNALLGLASTPATVAPSFNARGLPCSSVSGPPCDTSGGTVYFLYFIRLDGSSGTQWAAVSVTPAGRVRVWTWDGAGWE